jgi:uncharacterized C2H2 Zn-finger protein
MSRRKNQKPQAITVESSYDEWLLKCPLCCTTHEIDEWDCLGADEDCLFCPNCGAEVQS